MSSGGVGIVSFGKGVYKEFKDDDVSGLAAELSYRFFLALFPFLLFLTAFGGFIANAMNVANPADRFLELFGDRLPSDAESLIRTQVEEVVQNQNLGLISIGIIGALWASMGGAGSLMKAMNRTYDIPETRPFWKQKLLAFGLVIGMTAAIILGVAGIFVTCS